MSSSTSYMSKADKVLANVEKQQDEWNNLPEQMKASRAGRARARKIAKQRAEGQAGKLREELGLPEDGSRILPKTGVL